MAPSLSTSFSSSYRFLIFIFDIFENILFFSDGIVKLEDRIKRSLSHEP